MSHKRTIFARPVIDRDTLAILVVICVIGFAVAVWNGWGLLGILPPAAAWALLILMGDPVAQRLVLRSRATAPGKIAAIEADWQTILAAHVRAGADRAIIEAGADVLIRFRVRRLGWPRITAFTWMPASQIDSRLHTDRHAGPALLAAASRELGRFRALMFIALFCPRETRLSFGPASGHERMASARIAAARRTPGATMAFTCPAG